ncbi:superkiller complex protein 3 [Bacillus rossius redtenbacheri]|uniref:superkiller complex protein 3 n=1 Tax=Bacillus rossius redtenbacheri TaxID=93214 RepID=UPI002FDD6714
MDAKEIKALLKEAREAIKNKDHKTALKHCKTVLKYDRNNYHGLVLFGVSLQESDQRDQAPKAFRKAIEAAPKQILAWQGLASFYEKENSEEGQKELLSVYQQLLILESDLGKFTDICNKLAVLSVKLNTIDEFVKILSHDTVAATPERQSVVWKTVSLVLAQLRDLPDNLSEVLELYLRNVLKSCEDGEREEYYKKYLKVLYKRKKYEVLRQEATKMHSLCADSVYPLEWVCKVYSEEVARGQDSPSAMGGVARAFCNKLAESQPGAGMALVARGALLLADGDPVAARDSLQTAVSSMPHMWSSWLLMGQCLLRLYDYSGAEQHLSEARKLISKQSDEGLYKKGCALLIRALAMQDDADKRKEAVELGQQVLSEDPGNVDVLTSVARALIALGDIPGVKRCVAAVSELGQRRLVAYLGALLLESCGRHEQAVEKMNVAVTEDPGSAELWLELGLMHWRHGDHHLSLMALLKATKLDPNCYICYLYLGHHYKHGDSDLDKARRCYQKAFQLNPSSMEAGESLSDIYRQQKNYEANLQLLTYVTQQTGYAGARWAWLRLGLHHTELGNHQEAIDSLRIAIRTNPNDSHYWESLADAYYARGAYTASLKSYQRAVELSPEAVYPAYQIAAINQIIGLYNESVEQFKALVASNPDYVPALKGLGEACLCMARNYRSRQLLGCCMDSCQEAFDAIERAVEQRRDLSSLWKLLGNICSLASQLPDAVCGLSAHAWLVQPDPGDPARKVSLLRGSVFQLATRCYHRALALSQDNNLLWHDLAISHNLHADHCSEPEPRRSSRERALAAAKKSVLLGPRNWRHWDLVGVVATSTEIKNYSLAQHAFIKSVQLENNNPVSWTNLGVLYLCLNELKLANESFNTAQRIEPAYIESWIGQALLAEMVHSEDTMDLFRHTTQLGVHTESCLGYAHWVCTTLMSTTDRHDPRYVYGIEKMFAIPVAADAMTWYTAVVCDNPCAFNMLGLLLERQKLYGGAARAFEKALGLLASKDEVSLQDQVLENHGRVLVQLQKYDEAIRSYQQIKQASFHSQCSLAVAFFKAEKYEDSYITYETALEWLAPDDGAKSHVLVAMAAMTYLFQGVEDCKILLFQCIQLKPPSVQGLFASCALGMLHGDLNLSELTLKELLQYKDNPEFVAHIAVFKAYIYFLQDQSRKVESIRSFNNTVHRHPGIPSLWLSLALLLLLLEPSKKAEAAGRCAQVAMVGGRSTMDVTKVMSLVSLSHLLSGKATASLRSSQKAVHMFPDIPENWVVLIASFLPYCVHSHSAQSTLWLKQLISHVRRKLESSRQTAKWLSNYERKVTMLADECKKQEP